MGKWFPVDEVSRVASLRAVRRGGDQGGRPPVHRDPGGGSVRHRGGRGPTERDVHEEHRALSETNQTVVSFQNAWQPPQIQCVKRAC